MIIWIVFNGVEGSVSFNIIHSTNHDIYTEKATKVALYPTQDVRHVLPDKIDTLSVGHYKLREKEENITQQ